MSAPPFPLRVVADAKALAAEAERRVLAAEAEALRARGAFHVALSGGSTPQPLHRRLAASGADFARWHIWFGDERCVPAGSSESNFRMAAETLLERAPIPQEAVHRVRTELGEPAAVAAAYEDELRRVLGSGGAGPPRLDLVLLGMGTDGHTASLFPRSPALREERRLAVATDPPAGVEPAVPRVTLTVPVLNAARAVLFLVAGGDKAGALGRAVRRPSPPEELPALLVAPPDGELAWLADRAAAADVGAGDGDPA